MNYDFFLKKNKNKKLRGILTARSFRYSSTSTRNANGSERKL